MGQERWFRGSDEAAAFDWSKSARELAVSADIARALYVRALQRAAESGPRRAEELYLRWLRDAAKTGEGKAAPVPGRETRALRESEPRELRELERLGPGRWTRSLWETERAEAEDKPDRLPAALRARMEQAYGERFDDVELRRDSSEVAAGEQAFARDREIHLEAGADLETEHGAEIVAHELAHVAQQSRPAQAGRPASRAALEADAHQAAQQALAGQAAQVQLAAPRLATLTFSRGEASRAPASAAPATAHALDPSRTSDAHLATDVDATGATAGAASTGAAPATESAATPAAMLNHSAAELRALLIAAAHGGRNIMATLAAADPETAAAALRDLRTTSVLQLVTRATEGLATRVMGRGSVGRPLDAALADKLAPHVGEPATSAARIHTDEAAELIAAAHDAHAVTLADDVYFGRGEFAPGTVAGDELIAHELTHVAQSQRGELARAAAKGITSGTTLDPSEAEADLRARFAVIQIHAPQTTAPSLASPSGQPTSDGQRAALIAQQQQRLAQAGAPSAPITAGAAPGAVSPGAPIAHPLPAMTAPAAGASGNAYVDTFSAPPSKQALELWDKAGPAASQQATAEQAKFDASLQPMPAVLDGSPAPGTKGGGGSHVPGGEAAKGTPPPAAVAPPTPAAPPVTAGSTAAAQLVPGTDKAQLKADGQKVIANLPTTSPDVKTDPGPAPVTDLAGQGDPVRTLGDQSKAVGDGAKALDVEKAKILGGKGAAQVQPTKLDAKVAVPQVSSGGSLPALPVVDGMAKFKKWNLPTDAQGAFDAAAKPKMDGHLAEARSKMTQAEAKRDSERNKAVHDAQSKVAQANADADKQQQAKVAETRTQITNKQADTLVKQENEVKKLDQTAGDKKRGTLGKIDSRIQADQAKVESDYKDATKQAEDKKKAGEADAKKKKEEAEKKSNEDKSWWDKAVDSIVDDIKAIGDAIDHALEEIGHAIGQLLDAVKDAACKVIDAARDFVCAALTEFGDWLKSAVTALIGSVFPQLAAELNALIDSAVNLAKQAVTAIADGLKTAVTALCDSLKGAIEAAIAMFRAAVQAAVTFAQAAITGDWSLVGKMILEGVLKLLGIDPAAFYALIGSAEDSIEKIIANPGAFVGHLVDAVKLGFQQFGHNFWAHLKDGMVQWLFGTFAAAGITMPASFDVAGIFDLACQVMGLTWPRLRGKVVKVIGEKNTERLEFVSGYVEALITGGMAGLWEKVQQDMSGLWDMVIGGVKDWLIEKVVQQAIIKIATMWNPAGAIIQLIQTAWNVYQWVKENAQRIFGLVQAVVDSMGNIVAGNISGAANFIEASLAKLVPIAISLFANLLGLGGIADKIRGIIEKVQTKVDQAIDKLIDRVSKLFKGKDKGKDDKHADGAHPGDPAHPADPAHPDGKDGKDKKDDKKVVGIRVSFHAHGETHTQYIDMSGGTPVAMVASVPSAVKAKIEEWRPRLRELPDADQKKAGGLIGKAIAIEKNVSALAVKAKAGDSPSEGALEGKQRELADTLAGLFEVMAPDMDPSKSFSDQDPRSTLKSPKYATFKARFNTLATELAMPGGLAAAQDIWLKCVTALHDTDAAYKAAPTAPGSARKDLASDAFTKIMTQFDPLSAAIAPYMTKYGHGKKNWAFWSGGGAMDVAKKHADTCLEKSALGSLFDGLDINGSWDIQMWASLSKAYATHAAQHVGEAKYTGFVGMGSSADQSIFNKIEQPQFISMLSEKAKATLHIEWYAVAGDPKAKMKAPDYRFHAGSYDGVYATGDRATMVALAESENKRRLDLFNDKGIDEGPGGAGAGAAEPVSIPVDMNGAAHTLTAKPGANPTVELHSTPGLVKNKASAGMQNARKQASSDSNARVSTLELIFGQATQLETLLKAPKTTKPAIESALKSLATPIGGYGATHKASDLDEVGDVTEVPKSLAEPHSATLTNVSASLRSEAATAQPGAVLYSAATGDPKQVTKNLLANHPDAHLDKASGVLTLPPVQAASLESARSLREMATSVARMTGVSTVTFARNESSWHLDGAINPKIEKLANCVPDGGPLDDLKKSLSAELGKKSTTREVLQGICRERATKFGATVEFIDEHKAPSGQVQRVLVTRAHFVKGSDVWDTDIVVVLDDHTCPCCGRVITHPTNTAPPVGTTAPLEGLGPHSIIPSSVWQETFNGVLGAATGKSYQGLAGLSPQDSAFGVIRGAMTDTSLAKGVTRSTPQNPKGRERNNLGAASVDQQCKDCDNFQDRPLASPSVFAGKPATMLQRGEAVSQGVSMPAAGSPTGGGVRDYHGNQFEQLTRAQQEEVTAQKIEDVCDRIRRAVRRLNDSTAARQILTDAVLETFLTDLSAAMLTRAKAHVAPGEFPQ